MAHMLIWTEEGKYAAVESIVDHWKYFYQEPGLKDHMN